MNLLYPNLQWRWLPTMLRYALLGSIVAGGYGIIYDQITSRQQKSWVDFGSGSRPKV